jgi:hypothetical protein
MSDVTGVPGPSAQPPPPPPPPVVVEVRTVTAGGAVDVLRAVFPVPAHSRGTPDSVPAGRPPGGGVVGGCDGCGQEATQLVSWRVNVGVPPLVTIRGLCAVCAATDRA